MPYLLIFKIEKTHILSVNDDGTIYACDKPVEVLDRFQGYIRSFKSTYESSISATLGMMNTHPQLIRWDKSAEEIKEFIVDEQLKTWRGMLGSNSVTGIEVKPEIMMMSEPISVWGEVLIAAGMEDPTKSKFPKSHTDEIKKEQAWERFKILKQSIHGPLPEDLTEIRNEFEDFYKIQLK